MHHIKHHLYYVLLTIVLCDGEIRLLGDRSKDLVILDAIGVNNLGIQTQVVARRNFEETLFALGRIQPRPGGHAYVSSRVGGRIMELLAHEGEFVQTGDVVAVVESRQPGDPPPKTRLRAPISGLVVKTITHLGGPVEPNTPILEIVNLTQMYAVAKIPEEKVSLIRPTSRATIRLTAYPEQAMEGRWERFGAMANAESATLDAFFNVSDPEKRIRPEMRAEFTLLIDTRKEVMAVPREALQGDTFQPFVFVRDFELPNAFLKAPVKTGARNRTHVEIMSGLFLGDQVVTQGAYPLAFAGNGGVSLKEALDAAHGHEHNEDGSEMTAAQKTSKTMEINGNNGGASDAFTWFLGILCLIQWLLLLLKRKSRHPGQA
ncbi:MAG: efflux RND transporter periplasmic adaptor subunit [Verrucomicrobiota bacterium]|nr:efflux RND transporter periplasmic adaptor subunit [Verrucomicrobiota bacterium]